MKVPLLVSYTLLMGVWAVRNLSAEPTPAVAEKYGQFPTNYKELVAKWLETQLNDASSAHIEWNGEPKPANLGTQDKPLYGYQVDFKINARNRFGTYTGMQSHGVLIRDGQVIKGLGFGY
jgi:hypothetical protein